MIILVMTISIICFIKYGADNLTAWAMMIIAHNSALHLKRDE